MMDYVKNLLDTYGVENVVFLVPVRQTRSVLRLISYTVGDDPQFLMPCVVDTPERVEERGNYGHKLKLRCLVPGFESPRFYQSDLSSLVQDPENPHRALLDAHAARQRRWVKEPHDRSELVKLARAVRKYNAMGALDLAAEVMAEEKERTRLRPMPDYGDLMTVEEFRSRAINPKDIGYVDNPQEVRAFWINRIRWTDLG
jgi:hypothetical protein